MRRTNPLEFNLNIKVVNAPGQKSAYIVFSPVANEAQYFPSQGNW